MVSTDYYSYKSLDLKPACLYHFDSLLPKNTGLVQCFLRATPKSWACALKVDEVRAMESLEEMFRT